MFLKRLLPAAVLAMTLSVASKAEIAAPIDQIDTTRSSVTISNDPGGAIAVFALRAAEYKIAKTLVKFTGSCDSACTLFLALPSAQTCVTSGATFRFHAPFGVSANSQKVAQAYLMEQYPRWVRSWIGRKNGLTRELITMDYDYAKKFMNDCESVASR
jgi:hypothetical protein